MKKYIFIIGVVIGALITAFLFVKFQPRPGPDPEPVIVTVKEPVYVSDISGQATIPERLVDSAGVYYPDFKVTVPVAGEFATENAQVKVSGETIVERTNDLLTVNTIFQEAEVNVKYKPPPESPEKIWSVGAYFMTDGDSVRPGGFVQRDFELVEFWRVEAAAFSRVEVDMDTRLLVGIEFSF